MSDTGKYALRATPRPRLGEGSPLSVSELGEGTPYATGNDLAFKSREKNPGSFLIFIEKLRRSRSPPDLEEKSNKLKAGGSQSLDFDLLGHDDVPFLGQLRPRGIPFGALERAQAKGGVVRAVWIKTRSSPLHVRSSLRLQPFHHKSDGLLAALPKDLAHFLFHGVTSTTFASKDGLGYAAMFET